MINHLPSIFEGTEITVKGKKYEICDKPCGEGLFSEVYPAILKPPYEEKRVAVKIMHPIASFRKDILQDTKERKKAFRTEEIILSRLKDVPWVVRILDAQTDNDRPVIIEKLLDTDDDLSKRHNSLDLEQGFNLAAQLFSMLITIHKRHILYQDFKRRHFFWKWDGNERRGKLTIIDWNGSILDGLPDRWNEDFQSLRFNLVEEMDHLFLDEISEIISHSRNESGEKVLLNLIEFGIDKRFQLPRDIPSRTQLRLALLNEHLAQNWRKYWFRSLG